MNITVEQVEKVRACTGVTFEKARDALEQTGGNVLDAVILLEREGQRKEAEGSYSTRPEELRRPAYEWKRPTGRQIRQAASDLISNCMSVFLDVWKEGKLTCRVPLLAAVLLLIVQPYVTVGLLLLGLCLGYRVHFAGKGTEGWGAKVNQAVDQAVDTVSDAVSFLRNKQTGKKK